MPSKCPQQLAALELVFFVVCLVGLLLFLVMNSPGLWAIFLSVSFCFRAWGVQRLNVPRERTSSYIGYQYVFAYIDDPRFR